MYLLKYAEVFYFVPMPNHLPTSKVLFQSYWFVYLAVDSTFRGIKIFHSNTPAFGPLNFDFDFDFVYELYVIDS